MFGHVDVIDGPERFDGGLDTYVYGIRLAGQLPRAWTEPLVLRVYPHPEQAEKAKREAAVQQFAADRGIPAPRPLLVEPLWQPYGLPFMLMERATGSPLIERFKNPLAIRGAIRSMVLLQVRLHRVPVDRCPLPYESPLVDRLLDEPRTRVECFRPPGSPERLHWLQENASSVRDEEPALLHNDFHPLNLLANGERLTLLDWSDAAIGDRHCDVARTLAVFRLAPPLESNALLRTVLSILSRYIVPAYEAEYRKRLPLESRRLRYWQALHAFVAWLQIAVMRSAGEDAIGARPGTLDRIPGSLEPALRSYFDERAF